MNKYKKKYRSGLPLDPPPSVAPAASVHFAHVIFAMDRPVSSYTLPRTKIACQSVCHPLPHM